MAVGGQIQTQMAASRYCWIGESGEIRFDEGKPISAEGNLLRATDLDGNWYAFDFANEETVMAASAEWSINPTTLDTFAWSRYGAELRDSFNYDIARRVRRREKARLARQRFTFVQDFVQTLEAEKHEPYPVGPDPRNAGPLVLCRSGHSRAQPTNVPAC